MKTLKKLTMSEIIQKVDKLPDISSVAIQVSQMLDDRNVDFQKLSELITLDPSLTATLLKLCNSSHYSFSRKILTVSDAISKLGTKTVKSLVFVALSKGIMDKDVKGYSLFEGAMWQNSVTCAYYSKHLAEVYKYHNLELAFIAGLLRDIGKLIIDEYVGINYNTIIQLVKMDELSFSKAEEMVIGYNHAQIASEVLNHWKFPYVLVESIRYHHDLEDAYNYYGDTLLDVKLIALLHIADALTGMLGNSLGGDGLMYPAFDKAFQIISDKNPDVQIDEIIDNFVNISNEVNSMMRIIK